MNLINTDFKHDGLGYVTKLPNINVTSKDPMLFKIDVGVQVRKDPNEPFYPFGAYLNEDSKKLDAIKRKGEHRYWDKPEFRELEAKVRNHHANLKAITIFYIFCINWDRVITVVDKITKKPLFIRALNNDDFNVELVPDRTKIELMNISEIIVDQSKKEPLKLYTINGKKTKSSYGSVTVGVGAPDMESAIKAFKDDERYKDLEILNVAHKGDLHLIVTDNPN